jgi:hypothetical protein
VSKRAHAALFVLGFACFPGVARADGAAASAAQAAFDEGRRLEEAGDYAGAVAQFEKSERLDPALGTILNLATCYERAGRFASAWRAYERSVVEARATGEEKRAQRAQQLADALKPRLSSLTIDVAADVPEDTEIRVDGAALERARWKTPTPIDGGKHRVEVHANGRKDWSTEVAVAPSAQHVVLPVPALEAAPAGDAAAPPATAATATAPTAAPVRFWTAPRIAGAATAGAGLVAVGVGTVFGLQARSHWSDRESQCAFDRCTPDGVAAGQDAKDAALRANIAFIVGGAALATGAVLYFVVPNLGSSPVNVALAPAPGGGALSLGGAF